MNAFEFDGAKYAKAATHQREWGIRLIAELDLTGNETALDLGCGDGVLTEVLARRLPNGSVLGIDASTGMLEKAHTRSSRNLTFARMDIRELDFAERFDVVFSNAALHWIKDHRDLLTRVRKCVKPGGRVRFNFAGDGNCSHFNAVVREVMAQPRFAAYFADFNWPWYMPTVSAYEARVQGFTWQEARVWGENADRYFPDTEAMTRWLDQPSLVPFLGRVDAADKTAFRQEVVERMTAATRQADGTCFETFRRVNLAARKPPVPAD